MNIKQGELQCNYGTDSKSSNIRKHFPVKPAFGMTSNKSQRQTLEKVGIYLPKPMFSHGQFYVANSRVCSGNNVHIYGIYYDNVVYKKIREESYSK
ncbi:Hypothetical predicted protein [Octopus vulgaris]|uniref:Uncharacterized protein n=1 Tax=Octopus vulgaris TaxID=6645 RepID=A0AA36AKC8_OCTVU|nr:Hypothetical predicted protein [Octopus vulgaris]